MLPLLCNAVTSKCIETILFIHMYLVTTIDIVSASQVRNPRQRGYIAGLRSHVYQMEELGLTLGLLFVFFF